ncbi:MAG: tetratricopeptide repeat protein, partial [Asticcacaulis sp.]
MIRFRGEMGIAGAIIGAVAPCVALCIAPGVALAQASPELSVNDAVVLTAVGSAATLAAEQKHSDARLRQLRGRIDDLQAQVEAGKATLAQLTQAREDLLTELAQRDADYAAEIAAFRDEVKPIAEIPEGRALLATRKPGNKAEVRRLLRDMLDKREAARKQAENIKRAAELRSLAAIAEDDRTAGEATTAELIKSYEEIVALDPGYAWDWNMLCDLYQDAGDLAHAEQAARMALKITRAADAIDNGNEDRHSDLASSIDRLGDVLMARGDLEDARKAREESLGLRRSLAAKDASAAGWQRGVSVGLSNLGGVLTAQGDLAAARKAFEESLAISRSLAAKNPGHTVWQRDVLVCLNELGDVLMAQGDLAAARKAFEESLAI